MSLLDMLSRLESAGSGSKDRISKTDGTAKLFDFVRLFIEVCQKTHEMQLKVSRINSSDF